jgi:hypothetical protein
LQETSEAMKKFVTIIFIIIVFAGACETKETLPPESVIATEKAPRRTPYPIPGTTAPRSGDFGYETFFNHETGETTANITNYFGDSEQIEIPETLDGFTVKSIGYEAFAKTPITSVIIPETLKSISSDAFLNCKNLTEVIFPYSDIKFYGNPFRGTPFIENYTSNGFVIVKDVLLQYDGYDENYVCKEVIVPEGVRVIGIALFQNRYVKYISLPESLERIDDYAFTLCRIDKLRCKYGSFAYEWALGRERGGTELELYY